MVSRVLIAALNQAERATSITGYLVFTDDNVCSGCASGSAGDSTAGLQAEYLLHFRKDLDRPTKELGSEEFAGEPGMLEL